MSDPDTGTLSQGGISENHPIWHAIDNGGGQACDIRGVIRELYKAGYVIVPREPTTEMHDEGLFYSDGDVPDPDRVWRAMISAAQDA